MADLQNSIDQVTVIERQGDLRIFRQAVINLEPDLIFSGRNEENQYLKKMQYGSGFDIYFSEMWLMSDTLNSKLLNGVGEELIRRGR